MGRIAVKQVTNKESVIRTFITEKFLYGADTQFSDNDWLVETGLLDSTSVIELVAFLEASFALRILDIETTPDNLGTVDRIVAFIESKHALASEA
jgi:acyl carrier protein